MSANPTAPLRSVPTALGERRAETKLIAVTSEQPGDDSLWDSRGWLSEAASAVARLECEIDHLWTDAVAQDERGLSERLVAASHALKRVARLLEQEDEIG